MVHGGAFRMGDGNQDFMAPELFLDKNIVVVAINYRLGPFGETALTSVYLQLGWINISTLPRYNQLSHTLQHSS